MNPRKLTFNDEILANQENRREGDSSRTLLAPEPTSYVMPSVKTSPFLKKNLRVSYSVNKYE